MRRYACLAILVIAMIVNTLAAAPSSFLPLEFTQPDGSKINIYASGDEFHNWLHDENNYTIVRNDDGAYVYAMQERGSLVPSDLLVGRDLPSMRSIVPGLNLSQDEIKAKYDRYAQMRDYSNSRAPHTGQFNNIVIFIKFSDSPEFNTPFSFYQQVFNATGATDNSMRRYFLAASYNQLNVDSYFYPAPNGNVVVCYTDIYPRSYFQPYSPSNPNGYSGHTQRTEREQQMLTRAVDAVSPQIPYTLNIDADNDGYVDNVCFIIQGQPDGWAELLWPHRWVLFDDLAFINNKRVWDFNFQLESFLDNSGASVLAHEMFHSLGAPDLYRYYDRTITPIGRWDIMARDLNPPQHMSVWMKHKYGQWVNNVPTINTSGTYTLHPVASSSTNNIYRINSWRSNEFYLLEYRKPHGMYDDNIPGTGLLVYRLDTRYDGNANGPPDELYIYRPGGTNSVDGYLDLAALSAQCGRTEISEATTPNGFLGNGSPGGLNLFDVGMAGDTITFKVKISDMQLTYPHGGEIWISGDNKTITWERKSTIGTVKLEYSSDGGQTWNLITTGVGNTGSYTWNNIPPMNSSNEVHVRVTHLTTGQSDSNYYPFTVIGGTLPPPSDLIAIVQDQNVSLSWEAPAPNTVSPQAGTRDLLGYNVYRDGTLIASVTATSYLDESPGYGSHTYIVTASYTDGESAASNTVTVFVGTSSLPPPTDLQATANRNTVHLNWTPPSQSEEGIWMSWSGDEMYSSIGDGNAAIFDVAHRFTQADLADVSGGTITKVNFVPHESFCTYTVKVWTGGSETNAGTLVSSQVIPNPVMDEWNTVILTTPVPIPTTGDVYIGYECNTQTGYPAGCDFGPAVTGKGDMINYDGFWTAMSTTYNLPFNLLIQTFVDTGAGRVMLQPQPIAEAPRPGPNKARIAKSDLPAPITLSNPINDSRQLLGYKVYRDDYLINTVEQPYYIDTNLPFSTYSYFVTASYSEGESGPAGPVNVTLIDPIPPSNLEAIVVQTSVYLFWDAPSEPSDALVDADGTRQPQGYMVYRNGHLIATVTQNNYTDGYLNAGTYTYTVTASYTYGESDPTSPVTVTIASSALPPPTNLEVTVSGPTANLTWDAPAPPDYGSWLSWCNFQPLYPIGTNNAAIFDVAHRFTQADLAGVSGGSITRVNFMPHEANCIYTVKVWTGGSATNSGTLVTSQVVPNPVLDQWNRVVLNTPVPIPATGDVYIGYECNTQTGLPVVCDSGPAVAGKGDLINLGAGWESFYQAYNNNYNWMIQAFVDTSGDRVMLQPQPIAEATPTVNPDVSIVKAELATPLALPHPNEGSRQLLGYKVYRDSNLIATITENHYSDVNQSGGTFYYTVTASYTEGESIPAGPVTVTIDPDLSPPTNLRADVEDSTVSLAWNPPIPPEGGTWLSWSGDEMHIPVGAGGPTIFDVAHRFTQADLISVNGGTITKVKFVPHEPNCVYTVKVWTGGSATDAGTLVSSQEVPSPVFDAWNTVTLNTPVPIPYTGDVYVGYECNIPRLSYPAGCDAGPAVTGKGDMVYIQYAWSPMSTAYDINYNWLIQTFVETGAGRVILQPQPIAETPHPSRTDARIAKADLATPIPLTDPDSISRQLQGYKVYRDGNLIATINEPVVLSYTDPELPDGTYTYGVSALYSYGESQPATIEVNVGVILGELVFGDDFESYQDFDTGFYPWHLIDEDQANTHIFTDVSFPNAGDPMAYIIFNPSATVPPLEGLTCHSGSKMAACFAALDCANSDYLISPRAHLGTNSKLRFFARSHTDEWGLERFRVGVSTQPTISTDFEWLDATYVEAPTSWTEYIYDLGSYDGAAVRFAIHCQSAEGMTFYVDDFAIHSDGGTDSDDNTAPALTTRLEGNYPNPFNPSTTICYSLQEAGPVTIEIYNLKGQLVRTLVNEVKESGSHRVIWNGLDQNNRTVSSGVYLFRMKSGKYSNTRKMIMLK